MIVAIFQWGWLDFTGFHHLGHLNTINPSLILAITFGLSMDYEVFLLTRIRERYDLHGSNEQAVAEGMAALRQDHHVGGGDHGRGVRRSSLTGVPTIKEVGVGLASAIAIDATITRLVLVPATMRLLGDSNWSLPGWLDRRLPQMAHEAPAAGDEGGLPAHRSMIEITNQSTHRGRRVGRIAGATPERVRVEPTML